MVSGLDLVKNTDDLSLDLLSEWITGMAGCTSMQEEEAAVVKVIIAGKDYLYLVKSVATHKIHHTNYELFDFVQETAFEVLRNCTIIKAITKPNCMINIKSRKI